MKPNINPQARLGTVPAWMLLTTIFITGNVVMMLEVVGTRVVGPFFGVGIYVWSALITVTLLALAAGYWLGGRWADIKRRPELLYFIILLAALLTFLIPVVRDAILTFASQFGVRTGVLTGSAILFGGPLFLLGMVTPYAAKLFTRQFEELGSRVGLLYAISTLGSFTGTLAIGFYLIPTFRLSIILVSLAIVLALIPMIYFLLLRSRKWPIFIFLLLLSGLIIGLLPRAPGKVYINDYLKIIHKTTSFYGEIKVLEAGEQKRVLLVDGVTQSGENFKTHQAMPPYVRDMCNLIEHYRPKTEKVLVLGLGGGNTIHTLTAKGISVDIVEIDKKIVSVATKYFGIDPDKVNITLNDGRRFVRNCKTKYDAVILNTFNGESSPSHMLTQEFFRMVGGILRENGVVALNFVGYVQGPHRQGAASVYATMRAAFAWCDTYFREPKHKFSNIVFIAGNGVLPDAASTDETWQELQHLAVTIPGWEEAVVCTDDYNPIDFLNRVVYRRWRQLVIDSAGPEVLLN